jgi:hypothetical protein
VDSEHHSGQHQHHVVISVERVPYDITLCAIGDYRTPEGRKLTFHADVYEELRQSGRIE